MYKYFLKSQYLILVLFTALGAYQSFGQDTVIYKGFVSVNSSAAVYPYTLKLYQIDYKVKGISITNEGLKDETINKIEGFYNSKNKSMIIEEKAITQTNSVENLDSFCFLTLDLVKKKKNLKGDFVGYFNDSTICSEGKVLLMEDKIMRKKIKRLNKKLSKIDTVKFKKMVKNPGFLKKNMNFKEINLLKMTHQDSCYISVSEAFIFSVWDEKKEDGDIIKVIVNNEVVLDNFVIKNQKHKINFKKPNQTTKIKVIAKNIGDHPPNTVTMEIKSNNEDFLLKAKLNPSEYVYIEVN